jgi:fructose-specific phosphotransferase system IIA component
MKISQILNEDFIILNIKGEDKDEVLAELVEVLDQNGKIKDKEHFLQAVLEREKLGTTGIGKGIAIPHAKTKSVKEIAIVFARSKEGIDFDSLDDKSVNLIFLLAAPLNIGGVYLKTLAGLSRILRSDEYREKLINFKTKKEILDFIKEVEE